MTRLAIRSALVAVVLIGAAGAAAGQTEDLVRTIRMEPGGLLTLSNISGETTVTGVDGNELTIRATKRLVGRGGAESLDRVEIEIEERGSRSTSSSGRRRRTRGALIGGQEWEQVLERARLSRHRGWYEPDDRPECRGRRRRRPRRGRAHLLPRHDRLDALGRDATTRGRRHPPGRGRSRPRRRAATGHQQALLARRSATTVTGPNPRESWGAGPRGRPRARSSRPPCSCTASVTVGSRWTRPARLPELAASLRVICLIATGASRDRRQRGTAPRAAPEASMLLADAD